MKSKSLKRALSAMRGTAGTWLSASQEESLTENPTMLAPGSQTASPQNWERERPVGEAIMVFVTAAGAEKTVSFSVTLFPQLSSESVSSFGLLHGAILLLHDLGSRALVPEPSCCVRIRSHSVSTCCVFNQKQ